jgi:hypothetical protein
MPGASFVLVDGSRDRIATPARPLFMTSAG